MVEDEPSEEEMLSGCEEIERGEGERRRAMRSPSVTAAEGKRRQEVARIKEANLKAKLEKTQPEKGEGRRHVRRALHRMAKTAAFSSLANNISNFAKRDGNHVGIIRNFKHITNNLYQRGHPHDDHFGASELRRTVSRPER